MKKKELSRILASADRNEIIKLAEEVQKAHQILLLKPPARTMVMLQVKEPVKKSRFYLGEMLACHCVAEADGVQGASVMAGDDLEKAKAAALLDAAHTGAFPEWKELESRLLRLEEAEREKRRRDASIYKETRVDFRVLEDGAAPRRDGLEQE